MREKESMELSRSALVQMYKQMLTIRRFEEKVAEFLVKGMIHGTGHLYIGEEAVAVGACRAIKPDDYITSTHRGHGHCIAKGADLNRMMSELLGKETGYCKGKDGSMHIADVERGNLGANGVVGGGIPIACGAGITIKMKGLKRVVLCFFGDGAVNQGVFHESLNLASVWSLPVIFICENNQYAMSTATRIAFNIKDLSLRAASYGMPGVKVDGNDALGLLKSSIRDDNPVVFVEHKLLYSQKGEVPQSEYLVPLGEAQVKREGTDATIVALSIMVPKALAAADKLSKEGIGIEVIDPRTLVPLDSQTIVNSVKKTHRLLIVHEACGRGGFGAEILAQVEESEAFDYLDAPIRRLTGRNIPIPYSPGLERRTVPQEDDIIQAVRKLVG